MTWVRSDQDEPEHAKMLRLTIADYGFFQAAKCWSMRHLTDGFIPEAALGPAIWHGLTRARARRHAEALARATDPARPDSLPLFEPRENGWHIHDFLHYQPSGSDVRAERDRVHAAKVRAGRLGGLARVTRSRQIAEEQARSKHMLASTSSTGQAEGVANSSPVSVSDSSPSPSPTRKKKKSSTTTRAADAAPSDVRQVFEAYDRSFQERYHERPMINGGKDGANLKRLTARYGLPRVLELLAQFFASADPFILGTGHALGAFTSAAVVNKLLSQNGSAGTLFTPKTAGNAQAARAFVARGEAP